MDVIKRNGKRVAFDKNKIVKAIEKAYLEVFPDEQKEALQCGKAIAYDISHMTAEKLSVEEIQDKVEKDLIHFAPAEVVRAYIRYRYKRELLRKSNTTDKAIKELLNGESEFWNKENSNKNAKWVTTQRDYIAGITSKDIARRFIFPKEVIEAHDAGIIHIHDMDYMAQNTMSNCCLINLEDMLQNGTVVNGITIDKPHRLSTAMTIATQIIAAVASSQYGGCTINLAHLAPFVHDSFQIYYNKYLDWGFSGNESKKFAMFDTKKEVKDAVQTLNYQLNSLTTTNG